MNARAACSRIGPGRGTVSRSACKRSSQGLMATDRLGQRWGGDLLPDLLPDGAVRGTRQRHSMDGRKYKMPGHSALAAPNSTRHHPSRLTTDQKVGGSNPSERANKAAGQRSFREADPRARDRRIPIAVGMATSYRDEGEWQRRARRGTGSVRQRRQGVWEIRVVVAFDPVAARSVQRSFTVHGDEDFAMRRRSELVADFGVTRVNFPTGASGLTVGGLMERFLGGAPPLEAGHRRVAPAGGSSANGRPTRAAATGRAHPW